jgi:serine/threonine protein kinase
LRERSEVLLDLAENIAYFQSQTILHRDLKPCNIGFDHDGVLKLFDFDVSRLVPFCNNPNKEVFWLTQRVRSPRYMSPEVAQGITI